MGWNRIMIEVILRDCDLVVNNQTSTDTTHSCPKAEAFHKKKGGRSQMCGNM